jgi:hypothetical protein
MLHQLTADVATEDLVGQSVIDIELHACFEVQKVVQERGAAILVLMVIDPGEHYDYGAQIEIPVGPAHDAANRHLRIEA